MFAQVLLAHLFWVGVGSASLHALLPGFFGGEGETAAAALATRRAADQLAREEASLARVESQIHGAETELRSAAVAEERLGELRRRSLESACRLQRAAEEAHFASDDQSVLGGRCSGQEKGSPLPWRKTTADEKSLSERRSRLKRAAELVGRRCLRLTQTDGENARQREGTQEKVQEKVQEKAREGLLRAARLLRERTQELRLAAEAERRRLTSEVGRRRCEGRWFSCAVRGKRPGGLWVWWSLFGFALSCLLFNLADALNRWLIQGRSPLSPAAPVEAQQVRRACVRRRQRQGVEFEALFLPPLSYFHP